MPQTYSYGGYSVSVADDGAIAVKPGDSLSKYSMAIHHDFNHVKEFGRKQPGSATIGPIANINLIYAGETIYHLPTNKAKNSSPPPAAPLLPKVCAVATDATIKPLQGFPDAVNLQGTVPKYGQDITFGTGRKAPQGHNVGSTVADLSSKMRKLLSNFASQDSTGMATRLFNQFLAKQSAVVYFDDPSLNTAAAQHANIVFFMDAALSAPNLKNKSPGKTRIHQALKNANWDISKLTAPTDLGVPAFNLGSKWRRTEDFSNGLGVMINGVQHVFVIATSYSFDKSRQKYDITLKYIFYDVFGLDDDDLDEFGAESDSTFSSSAAIGITAWWQLQHQHGFAPLVTRIIVEKTFKDVPAQ